MKYHAAIIDLLKYILQKGEDYVTLLNSGNAYDKIIRNYHQFNHKGEKVYRNKSLMIKHFRFSECAWKHKDDLENLYFEHLYPIKLIKSDLLALIGCEIRPNDIKQVLDKTEIVVLSKEEAKSLDKVYKDKMPEDDKNRLEAMGINIQFETLNSSLFDVL
jgi:hypothetical protein